MYILKPPNINIETILVIVHLTDDLSTQLRLEIIALRHETFKNVILCGRWEIYL